MMPRPDLNVLIIGGGGREHALYLAMKKSPRVARVIVTPGNAGIPEDDCWPYKETQHDDLIKLALAKKIGLVIFGPEAPIVAGLADEMRRAGLRVFAPTAEAARLESSKGWAMAMCQRAGVPIPASHVATSCGEAEQLIRQFGYRVVKANGLCAGKGVVVADSEDEAIEASHAMLRERIHGEAGARIVLQERLIGREASFMFLCDGVNAVALPPARDFKRLEDGDLGPNTGGMGAYAPLPDVTPAIETEVLEKITHPILALMRKLGTRFSGLLYVGAMLTDTGPKLIEFNVRFGDPETQVVLPLIESDLATYLLACTVDDGLSILPPLELTTGAAVCTVIVSGGYPGIYETARPITGLGKLPRADYIHAGTRRLDEGGIVTSGGRVLGCVGYGEDVAEARAYSQSAADKIHFEGSFYRHDIAAEVE